MNADDLDVNEDDRPDPERFELGVHAALAPLIKLVGLPPMPDRTGPRVQIDVVPMIDRDQVSFSAHIAVCNAIECLGLALTFSDPTAPELVSVEDGLAAMSENREP
jgi:hypothetical protein